MEHNYAVGTDPLATFGPNAARHLKRTDSFGNAPDILVNSRFEPTTGEVAAFEELVGSHGGLGGPQTQPYLLFPTAFASPDSPLVGPAALHACLAGWRKTLQARSASAQDRTASIAMQLRGQVQTSDQ